MRAVFLNGTVGVGKTTTAQALSRALEGKNISHAVIDTDAMRQRWPAPTDDPFDNELELRNLSSVCANYRAAGVQLFIVSGVIEQAEVVGRYASAAGVEMADFGLVRLTASPEVIEQRIKSRHHTDDEEREWHLNRAPELADILDKAGLPGITVDADGAMDGVIVVILGHLDI